MTQTAVAVAGATGTAGRLVVDALERRGARVVRISRSGGVDVATGRGLTQALDGVDVVVDVMNAFAMRSGPAIELLTKLTRRLLAAERDAGVRHHVLLSIVAIDHAPYGYYAGKLAQERLVREGPVPFTIQRATQFHEFAGQTLTQLPGGPLVPVPIGRLRPVAASDVAECLATLAMGDPQQNVADLRGPRPEFLTDMIRKVLAARGQRRRVLPVPLPGRYGRALRSGVLCGEPDAESAALTFTDWLDQLQRKGKQP